jgi:hypothetical protein
MNNSNQYLTKLFLKIVENIENDNWQLEIINTKKFRKNVLKDEMSLYSDEDAFEILEIFDKENIDEYAANFLLYKWLKDHNDKRYREFSYVIKPYNKQIIMENISLEELIEFISPETWKTMEND